MRSIALAAFIGLIGFVSARPLDIYARQASASGSVSSFATRASSTASGSASAARSSSTSSASPSSSSSGSGVVIANNTDFPTNATDLDVLNFAFFLEQLEINFYLEGVNDYDASAYSSAGQPVWVRERYTEIVSQENTRCVARSRCGDWKFRLRADIATIAASIQQLGGTPAAPCNYSFGVDSVNTFLGLAPLINGLGPAAYTGAAQLITNKQLLTVASQILSVEARHNAWASSDVEFGDAFPQTFQSYLSPAQAYTVASQFVASCPSNNTRLSVTAFPSEAFVSVPEIALAVSPTDMPVPPNYYQGQSITLKQGVPYGPAYGVGNATYTPATAPAPQSFNQTGLYAVFLSGQAGNFTAVPLGSNGTVTIPTSSTGATFVVVTNSTQVSDSSTVAGPALVNIAVAARDFSYQSTTNI